LYVDFWSETHGMAGKLAPLHPETRKTIPLFPKAGSGVVELDLDLAAHHPFSRSGPQASLSPLALAANSTFM